MEKQTKTKAYFIVKNEQKQNSLTFAKMDRFIYSTMFDDVIHNTQVWLVSK